MTLAIADIKPLVKAGIDDAYINARLDVVADQITRFVGEKTVAGWGETIPASAKMAAAKLINHLHDTEDHDEAMASETMSNYSRSMKLEASGLPATVEAWLKPLRRIESVSCRS